MEDYSISMCPLPETTLTHWPEEIHCNPGAASKDNRAVSSSRAPHPIAQLGAVLNHHH